MGSLLEKDILCFPAIFFTKMKRNKEFFTHLQILDLVHHHRERGSPGRILEALPIECEIMYFFVGLCALVQVV